MGPLGGHIGTALGGLELSWRLLEALFSHLEVILGHLEAMLELCCAAWGSAGGF